MKREDGGVPLAEVVGRNARRLRGDATADEVAKACRQHGLNWGTGRISELEHGRVSPTLSTLVVLATALGSVRGQSVALADLVDHDGFIALASGPVLKSAALQRFLRGEPVVIRVRDVPRGLELKKRALEALTPKAMAKHFAELPPAVNDAVDNELTLQLQRRSGEAEARMAKALSIDEENFATLSAYLWNRTLSAERDRRAGPDANAQDRGRITRQLKAEMEAVRRGKD
jgi:hypothetical protein